jgi:choice-of-anchor A domain-containing protein
MRYQSAVCSALTALVAGAIASSASATSVLSDWNLIVFGNLNSTQEVEGRTLIGGNLTTGSSQYGTKLNPGLFAGTDVLVVGGNINGGNVQIEAGNLRLGGSQTGNLNFNGGGSLINDPSAGNIALDARAEVLGLSSFFNTLTPNSTVSIPNGQPGPLVFNAVANVDGVAVFHVDGNQIFGNGLVQQFDLNLNGATSVIINVSGTSINHNAGNLVGNFNSANASTILWNFYEATTINTDRLLYGAVLAPDAHLTNSTVIAGSVAVNSFTQNGEVHLPNYNGYVPTPGTALLLATAGLFASRRRR